MIKHKLLISFVITCLPLSQAIAETSDSFWYSGIDIGQGYYSNGGNEGAIDGARHRLAGGLHLGYQFNPYFSTELAYQYLGSAYANYSDGKIGAEFQQGVLSARLGYPITQNITPYIKMGGAAWFGDTSGLNTADANGFSPVVGAGVSYALSDNLAFRAEYQLTQSIGDAKTGYADHDLITLGVNWRFGHSPKAVPVIQEHIVEVEKLVIVEVEVEKLVVVEKPVETKVFIISSQEESALFAHNAIQLISTQVLLPTLQFLQQYPESTINITGHTDDLGTEKYNLWLSERRAKSVADYFTEQGIEPSRISVIAAGEVHPIADNGSRSGRAMNRRVEMRIQSFETNIQNDDQ